MRLNRKGPRAKQSGSFIYATISDFDETNFYWTSPIQAEFIEERGRLIIYCDLLLVASKTKIKQTGRNRFRAYGLTPPIVPWLMLMIEKDSKFVILVSTFSGEQHNVWVNVLLSFSAKVLHLQRDLVQASETCVLGQRSRQTPTVLPEALHLGLWRRKTVTNKHLWRLFLHLWFLLTNNLNCVN